MSGRSMADALRAQTGATLDSRVKINGSLPTAPEPGTGGPDGTPGAGKGQGEAYAYGLANHPGNGIELSMVFALGDGALLEGTDGKDVIQGGEGDDTIIAMDGNDIVKGDGGDDDIDAGGGDDNVNGGQGNDLIDGGDGDDNLKGMMGDDTILGGDGDDKILGGHDDDEMSGGAGDDRINGGDGIDTAVYEGSIVDFSLTTGDDGELILTDLNTDDGDEGTDTLEEVEVIEFADFTYQVGGNNDPLIAAQDVSTDEDTPTSVFVAVYHFDAGATATLDLAEYLGLGSFTPVGTSPLSPGFGTGTLYEFAFDPTPVYDFLGQGQFEPDSVTLEASDGDGAFAQRVIEILVAGVNDAPVASDDVAQTDEETPVNIDVLFNDSDIDQNDSLRVSEAAAENGTVVREDDGTLTYTPGTNFVGDDTITYTLADLFGGTDEGQVIVTVDNTNDPPEPAPADDPAVSAFVGDGVFSIDLNDRVTDPDGDLVRILSAQVIDPGTGSAMVIDAALINGVLQLDPAQLTQANGDPLLLSPGEQLVLRVEYVAQDNSKEPNDTATGFVDVTIVGGDAVPNTAPAALDFAVAGNEADGLLSIDFSGFVSDDDGDPLQITALVSGEVGEIGFTVVGGTTIEIDLQQFGLESAGFDVFPISYFVDDGTGTSNSSATATLTLSVTGADDPPPPDPDNLSPTGADIAREVDEEAGLFVLDLNPFASDPDEADILSIVNIVPPRILPDGTVDLTDGILTIDTAGFGLDTGESETLDFIYFVEDNSGETNNSGSGTLSLTVNGFTEPAPEPQPLTLDFEPFSAPDPASTVAISVYEGFRFGGLATVVETDEVGDGREPTGLENGQTTPEGQNVLSGANTFIEVPVIDPETGEPVLDGRGEIVVTTELAEAFAIYAPGSTYGLGETIAFVGPGTATTPLPPLPDPLPTPALDEAYGTAFDLDGLSLNLPTGAGDVTITSYTLGVVAVPVPTSTNVSFEVQLVEVDSFVFEVDAATSALEIDFNADVFVGLAPDEVSDPTAFDGIYAITAETETGTVPVILDDIFVTV